MIFELSILLAVMALVAVIAFSFLVANQIGPGCPHRIRFSWVALALTATWLIGSLTMKGWEECLGWAIASFAAAVVAVMGCDRRGRRHLPFLKARA